MLEKNKVHNKQVNNDQNTKILIDFINDLILMLDQLESESLRFLKKHNYKSLSKRHGIYVQNLYLKYKNILNLDLKTNYEWGLNFIFHGITGPYYYPSILYTLNITSFNEVKNILNQLLGENIETFEKFQLELFQTVYREFYSKSSLSPQLMESLTYILSRLKDFDSHENIDTSDLIFSNKYKNYYVTEFTELDLKKTLKYIDEFHVFSHFTVPDPKYFNLGSFILKNDEMVNEDYRVYPYWLITDLDGNNLFTVNQISPENYSREIKNKIKSIGFFINFNNYIQNNNYYSYKLPNLFDLYDLYLEQKYTLSKVINGKKEHVLQEPNWSLEIKTPQKLFYSQDQIENETISTYMQDKHDLIIHLYNRSFPNDNMRKIIERNEKNNYFTKMFYYRHRLFSAFPKYNVIIDVYDISKSNQTLRHRIKAFLSASLPTGIIIEYQTGLLFFFQIQDDTKKEITHLNDFLDFLQIKHTILSHNETQIQAFLLYFFPPSTYFNNENFTWNFPERNVIPTVEEFKQLQNVKDKIELSRLQNNDFNFRVNEFKKFLNMSE